MRIIPTDAVKNLVKSFKTQNSSGSAIRERLGKLIENTQVRLSELAHESKSGMFLTPSGDVFWRPVGDKYEMCVCERECEFCVCYVCQV